jgi:hypothetical protein
MLLQAPLANFGDFGVVLTACAGGVESANTIGVSGKIR